MSPYVGAGPLFQGGEDGIRERDRLIAAVLIGHDLALHRKLSIQDLKNAEFIVQAGRGRSVMNGVVNALCAEAGFVPHVRHEVEETSTLVTLVAAGVGVSDRSGGDGRPRVAGVRYVSLVPRTLRVELVAAHLATAKSPLLDRRWLFCCKSPPRVRSFGPPRGPDIGDCGGKCTDQAAFIALRQTLVRRVFNETARSVVSGR